MKDYANSRLKLKRTVIWAFCLHRFGWYLKVKVGLLKAKTLFKYCGYWNSQTLDRITDHANKFYKEKLNDNNHPLTINNFPQTLHIYDADINIAFNLEKQRMICSTSLGSKLLLQKLITDNTKDNTGFFMWISNYCFNCIFSTII